MNMTLTQVSTQQIYSATLSSITRAQGTVRTNQEKSIKAPGQITIGEIDTYLYAFVDEGQVLATISLPEEREDLETAKKNLADLEKEMEYIERKPSESSDYYDLEMAVVDGKLAVHTPQETPRRPHVLDNEMPYRRHCQRVPRRQHTLVRCVAQCDGYQVECCFHPSRFPYKGTNKREEKQGLT